jgi:2-phosphoglycerate kinase
MAVIIDDEKRIPFLRGMLTHYLIENAFSFEEAYEVADMVRSSLQKKDEVPREDALRIIRDSVSQLFGDRAYGDGVFWAPGGREVLVEDSQGRRPFSRARVSHSLTLTGIDDAQAYSIAEEMLGEFRREERDIVTRDHVRDAALRLLKAAGGKVVADRYACWHEFRNADPPRPIIILLGGTSGVGKTSVGVALANLLKISRVASTDEIRQVMRLMISPDLMPTLHKSSYAAWENYPQGSVEDGDPLIPAFHDQASRVCVGVRATIERALEEASSLVIDGVHLLPEILDLKPYKDQATFVLANLYISDSKMYRERFKMRGRAASSRPQHRYLRYMKEIQRLQSHILEMGEANKVQALENSDFDETLQSLSLHIIDTLRKSSK